MQKKRMHNIMLLSCSKQL